MSRASIAAAEAECVFLERHRDASAAACLASYSFHLSIAGRADAAHTHHGKGRTGWMMVARKHLRSSSSSALARLLVSAHETARLVDLLRIGFCAMLSYMAAWARASGSPPLSPPLSA